MSENFKEAKILETEVQDGLENLVANLGTSLDKRNASRFVNNKRLSAEGNQVELSALYRTDWLAGKAVDIIPNDMTREWRTFNGDIDIETIKLIEDEEKRLDLSGNVNMGHKWARLFGTSLILISIDDGKNPNEPLDLNAIKPGSLRHLKVVDRTMFAKSDVVIVEDPMDVDFGLPMMYRLNNTSVNIHHSRVIRFDGVKLPYREFQENNFISDSVLDRLYDPITNVNTVTTASASMVYESNVDIVKVDGLMTHLQTESGETLLRKRFSLANLYKSINSMLLLDTKETFQAKTNSFSGLPELLDRYLQIVTAATDIPATRLLGIAASGFNATGEGDLKNYYDMIRAMQNTNYKNKLDKFDLIIAKNLGLSEDADLSYEFNSLFQMTPKEQADLNFTNAQRDQIYLQNDIVNEEIVAKELKSSGAYTNITSEFIETLEENDDDFDTDTDDIEITDPEKTNEECQNGENTEELSSEVSEGTTGVGSKVTE